MFGFRPSLPTFIASLIQPLSTKLDNILKQGTKIMTAIADLQSAVATLTSAVNSLAANVAANDAAIQAEITALQAAEGNPHRREGRKAYGHEWSGRDQAQRRLCTGRL
jgi:formiminotetrahydrofolate cyclodeaminase